MKKRNIILGLSAGILVAASSLLMVACGSTTDLKTLTEKTEAVVQRIKESEQFKTKNLSIEGKEIAYYAPIYTNEISAEMVVNPFKDYHATDFTRLYTMYDLPFGYSFNVIESNLEIMKSATQKSSLNKKSVENFEKALNDFNSRIAEQEKDVKNTINYLSSINSYTTEIARNAIYNYQKDYQFFVRSAINLAQASNEFVANSYNVSFKEEKITNLSVDTIFELNKVSLAPETKVVAESIVGTVIKVISIDSEGIIYDALITKDKLQLEEGAAVEINKEYKLKSETQFTCLGKKKVAAGKQVKVSYVDDVLYVVELVENGKVYTQTYQKKGDAEQEAVNGEIKLEATVTTKAEGEFEFKNVIFGNKTAVKVLETVGEKYRVQHISEKGMVYSAIVGKNVIKEEKIEKDSTVTLKSDVRMTFEGKLLTKGQQVVYETSSITQVKVTFVDKSNNAWEAWVQQGDIAVYEPSYLDTLVLDTLDTYYSFLVEKFDAKYLTDEELVVNSNNQIHVVVINNDIFEDYKDFIADAFVEKESVQKGGLTDQTVSTLKDNFETFSSEKKSQSKNLKDFDMYDYRFNKEFNAEELSTNDLVDVTSLLTFYSEDLSDWTNYYFNII